MTNEINRSRRTLAGTVEKHDEATQEGRRKIVNLYAQQEGLIDETEDLFDDWEDAHKYDLRSVQSYVDGSKKDWEEAKKAIDDASGWTLGKREFTLGLLSAFGLGSGSVFLGTKNSGGQSSADIPEYQAGEAYSIGAPDNFDSLILDESDFYDWVNSVEYEIDDLGVDTYSKHSGVSARVRELKGYDEENNLAELGEEVLGQLEPEDLNQRRLGQ